jgi:tryptophanyl-tRNA synthetase
MDLQNPERKMSTTGATDLGTVYVLDQPDQVRRKFKSAVTDSGTDIVRSPDKAGISNLIDILAVIQGQAPEAVEKEYAEAGGYAGFKEDVGEAVAEYLRPTRERYAELRPDAEALEEVLAGGAEKARAIASPTVAIARERMGVGPPGR